MIDDLTGQMFGGLKVLSFSGLRKNKESLWLCECGCGTTKVIRRTNLVSGRTKSCGCFKKSEFVNNKKHKRVFNMPRYPRGVGDQTPINDGIEELEDLVNQ